MCKLRGGQSISPFLSAGKSSIPPQDVILNEEIPKISHDIDVQLLEYFKRNKSLLKETNRSKETSNFDFN